MVAPKLHTDSLQIHAKTSIQAHAKLLRTIIRAVGELTDSGLLIKGSGPHGTAWTASGAVVVEEFTYVDSVQRTQTALRFGSWLCLALALKVTQADARQAFIEVVEKHPLR